MSTRGKIIWSTILMSFSSAYTTLMACPSCSDNYTKGSAQASVGEAYSYSVLFLLAVPITILSLFIFFMVRKYRSS